MDDLDIAIVGGGVAGCYLAYRLNQRLDGDHRVKLFEASNRLGGRLFSVQFPHIPDFVVELGGMFFSEFHTRVQSLARDELGLAVSPVEWDRANQYLRRRYLNDASYIEAPESVPFELNADECGKAPGLLLVHALSEAVPRFTELWPLSTTGELGSKSATLTYLRSIVYAERPLVSWGFWNLLSQVLSHEAYTLLLTTLGSSAMLRNANAYDSIWMLLREIGGGQYYRLDAGYEALPEALWQQASKGVDCAMDTTITSIRRAGKCLTLTCETRNGASHTVSASRVILALPRRAIQCIDLDDVFDDMGNFEDLRDAVISVPASKLFLAFHDDWWMGSAFGPGRLERDDITAAYTDLPLRQCYYFGGQSDRGYSVLMASYADGVASGFWAGLTDDSVCGTFPSNLITIGDDTFCASRAMIASACNQLTAMHSDISVPTPDHAIFVDWAADPFGGAWHAWKPYTQSWDNQLRMLQPQPDIALHICGEAYSDNHGWVEGALQTVDHLLQKIFPTVDSAGEDDAQTKMGTKMTHKLTDFFVAIGEDEQLLASFVRAPEDAMSGFGLGSEEQAAVIEGDEKKIRELIGNEGAGFATMKIIVAKKLADD